MSPCPVIVTNRIIIFLVGDPNKPPFATVTGRGTTQNISPKDVDVVTSLAKYVDDTFKDGNATCTEMHDVAYYGWILDK